MMLTDLQQATASLADRAWPEDRDNPQLADCLIARLAEETGELAKTVRLLAGPRPGRPGEAAATYCERCRQVWEARQALSRLQQNGAQTGPPSRYTVTLTDEERQIVCEALSVYTDHCAEYEDHPTAAVRETASTKKLQAWAILSRLQQNGGEG